MRRHPRPAASLVAVGVLLLAACQNNVGSSPGSSAAGDAITIGVSQTDAGEALSGAGGLTLYLLTTDTATTSSCTGGCATAWRPLLGTAADVAAGDGVSGTFGTITRDDGSQQVSFDGHPLYYYSGDGAPGESTGDGVGGVWFIVPPSGEAAETEPPGGQSEGERPSATPYTAPGY